MLSLVAVIAFFECPVFHELTWDHWTKVGSMIIHEGQIRHCSLSYEIFRIGNHFFEYFNYTIVTRKALGSFT